MAAQPPRSAGGELQPLSGQPGEGHGGSGRRQKTPAATRGGRGNLVRHREASVPLPSGLHVSSPGGQKHCIAGALPEGVCWQSESGIPLDPAALDALAGAMQSWPGFVRVAARFGFPLAARHRQIPAYAENTIQKRASLTDAAIVSFRAEQQAKLEQLWALHAHEPAPRWHLLQKLAAASNVPDCNLGRDGIKGFLMHGALPESGNWPPKREKPLASAADNTARLEQLLAEHAQARSSGQTRGHPGTWKLPNKHEAELLSQLRQGVAKGWWVEHSPEGASNCMGDYLVWLYFGVEQIKDSGALAIRGCLAPDGINEITYQPEQIYMAGVDGVAAVSKSLHKALGMQSNLVMAREDWRSGFYQIPIHPLSSRLLCAAAWDPSLGVRVFQPQRLGFGGAGAPYQFCRVATAAVQVLAHFFWVPAVPHMDDTVMLDTPAAMPSARQAHILLHTALGFELAEDKAVPSREALHPKPGRIRSLSTGVRQGIALGVEWNFHPSEQEAAAGVCAWVRLPDHKSEKYDQRLATIVARGSMSAGEARKISGTVDYAASVSLRRRARAFRRPIRDWEKQARSQRRRLTQEIRDTLQALRVFVADRSWQPILLNSIAWRFVLVFSDARGKINPDEPWWTEHLAAFALTAAGGCYTSISVSDGLVRGWLAGLHTAQRINECEALAALLAIGSFREILVDADVLIFVDSTAAEGSLCKGLSSSRCLSAIASAFWTQTALCRASVWVGRVPSKLNVADGPSRQDFDDVQKHGWAFVKPWLPAPQPWALLLK